MAKPNYFQYSSENALSANFHWRRLGWLCSHQWGWKVTASQQSKGSEHQEMQLIQVLFLYMYKKINWQLMLHDLLHTGKGLEFNCYNCCLLLLLLSKWKEYCICYLGMNCWLKVKWNLAEYSVCVRHQQGSLVHGSATQMLPMLKVAMENCLSFRNMNRLVVNINLVINLFQGVALKIVK